MSKRIGKSILGKSMEPEWLSAFPALAAIRDEAWLQALRAAKEVVIPPGTMVVRRGDPCANLFLIWHGSVRVYESSDRGREIALYRTGGGEPCILTLITLLAGSKYVAEARADDEVRAVAIPAELFRNAMNESEIFRDFIMATLARRLGDVMRTVKAVTFQHLDLRLACLLGQLFERNESNVIEMTHEDLAHELGTTRVFVSRMLKEFERMGCIRLNWRRIELVSPTTLARLTRDSAV
jgi:CRP/FNR family transcriptional regulator, anaerobic regulatory protein